MKHTCESVTIFRILDVLNMACLVSFKDIAKGMDFDHGNRVFQNTPNRSKPT